MIEKENMLTFTNFFDICRSVGASINGLKFEGDFRSKVEADMRVKGTFIEISEKLKILLEKLQPFINDKLAGKWFNITGTLNLHEDKGYLDIQFGFRGVRINPE